MKNTAEQIRRYTETVRVMRGLYTVTVRENRESQASRHRVIARRLTRTKKEADQTARQLLRAFKDPATPGEFDNEREAAL